MKDTYKLKGQRKRLIDELRKKGIKDEKVLEIMERVPRHFFFLNSLSDKAYLDQAFQIDEGQTISQPYTVAFMTELLSMKPNDKILEIGTGSGYQAAILAEMGAKVYTIERHEILYRKALEKFESLSLKINCIWGDGSAGLSKYAPFNGIIVTAAAPPQAEDLKGQLAIGGKLVMPVGDLSSQKMMVIERIDGNTFSRIEKGDFKFVPLLGRHGFK